MSCIGRRGKDISISTCSGHGHGHGHGHGPQLQLQAVSSLTADGRRESQWQHWQLTDMDALDDDSAGTGEPTSPASVSHPH